LATKGSVLWTFMDEWFPNTALVGRSGSDPGPIQVTPVITKGYPWSSVGTALDYRIRFFYRPPAIGELVAHRGAQRLAGVWGQDDNLPVAFEQLNLALSEALPSGTDLWTAGTPITESRLARLCFVLALYESCARAEPQTRWPIAQLGPRATLADVEKLCPDAATDDLVALADLYRNCPDPVLRDEPVVLNPTFFASHTVGGADGDLILGSTLIDIKTTIKGRPDRSSLWQLAGYALCDDINQYDITHVGLYFARFGRLVRWELSALLEALATRPIDMIDLRQAFGELSAADDAGRALPVRPKRLTPYGVVRTADFYPTRSKRGNWHLPYSETPGCTPPPGIALTTTPACGSKAVLDPSGSTIRPLQGRRFSAADPRLCRKCLRLTGITLVDGDIVPPKTVTGAEGEQAIEDVFPGELRVPPPTT
jgi:hypothetical protein